MTIAHRFFKHFINKQEMETNKSEFSCTELR